jgi:hypothetical protein
MRFWWIIILFGCSKSSMDSSAEVQGPSATVRVEPEAPLTSDDLFVVVGAEDAVGAWSVDVRWLLNGVATTHSGPELSSDATSKGDVWSVEAVITDEVATGRSMVSDGIEILNSGPGAPVVTTLPSSPRVGHRNLVCQVSVEADDPDDDALAYTMSWERDGEVFGGSTQTSWPGDTVPVSELVEGELWRCSAVASDGDLEGPVAQVEAVVVEAPLGFREGEQLLSDADRWFVGEDHMDFFGFDIAASSDIDGDGIDDLIATGHRMEAGGRNNGRSFVFSGADLAADTTTDPKASASWIIDGSGWFDFAGYAVAGVGDTDGDGLSDLLISTHNSDEMAFNSGSVSLFTRHDLGDPGTILADSASTRFIGESLRAYTGFAVDGAGDVDGDGWPDIIIGAMGNLDTAPYEGKAYVVRRSEFASGGEVVLGDTGTVLLGEHRRAYAGWAVAGAGDVDADGLDDVLVSACGTELGGASEDEDEGAAYLVTGEDLVGQTVLELQDATRRWTGEGFHAYVGYDVAGVGDVDGDGRPDVAVSALMGDMDGQYPGRVFLVFGSELTESGPIDEAPVQFFGTGVDDQFGREVSGGGDMDGDGRSDLLIGGMTAGFDMEGMAVVWLGQDIGTDGNYGASDAFAIVYGEGEEAFLGAGLTNTGDFNGDGLADLAIGAHNTESPAGRVGVFGVFFMN